eukprot:TRINITY_DN1117_c0_g1_i6.p1 TRINITY_DN1117_c0_g1~~TRINITY_DN1117_c0_g1_i6.p1  ORF type:complete len:333 (+),score=25.88 TRINITY_DN1117_c0_g1_i6:235-1233(+)
MGIPRMYPPLDLLGHTSKETIHGECCMLFGTVESDPTIICDILIYDPQSGQRSVPPSSRLIEAKQTAIVANFEETKAMVSQFDAAPSSSDPAILGEFLREAEDASAVVVKNGCAGATVLTADGVSRVPCFGTESVFSIGSGDVFSSVFAWYWGHKRLTANRAAELASAATAFYCQSRVLPIPSDIADRLQHFRPLKWKEMASPQVYLAGPLFTLPEVWLLAECKRCLEGCDIRVFSPKDDVGYLGTAGDSTFVAQEDLRGLRESNLVLAFVDGLDAGTLFEIGYARAIGIPVVLMGACVSEQDLTMLLGSGCELYRDLTTAIHHTVWKLRTE